MDDLFNIVESGLRSTAPPRQSDSGGLVEERPSFLEFFAGSGLVAHGLKGLFRAAWANDLDAKKAAVYIANHGPEHFQSGSIADVHGDQLPEAAMAWASFPCQDLSLAGLAGGIHASRSGLVWQWLRVIDEMSVRPMLLVAENVAGLVSSANGDHYRALHRALAERGYRVGPMLVDAIKWVPQSRPRIFVVAVDSQARIPEQLIGTGPTWLHTAAIRKVAEGLGEWIWWDLPEPRHRPRALSEIVEWDAPFDSPETEQRNINLISPRHRAILDAVPPSRRFAAPGYKRTRNGKQVLELRFDDVAGCLRTPEGGSSRQVLIVRVRGQLHSRLLTVRETGRLMGAPESYRIPGSYNDGYKAMGDAVAAPVARWLGRRLLAPIVRLNAAHSGT